MPMLGSVRRRLLTPALAEVTFERRGFPGAAAPAAATLEAVPQAVICGFEWGIEVRSQWELQRRLELLEPGLRGFGYEGATMACTVRDAMGPGGRRTQELLLGPGQRHIFLAYIGIGFAMARLPRMLWRKVLPDLPGTPYHPVMSWLAVDGYGFDRAYFDTPRWVDEQWVGPNYPWLGCPEYFPRAVDQGIGRALWFIHGAEPAGWRRRWTGSPSTAGPTCGPASGWPRPSPAAVRPTGSPPCAPPPASTGGNWARARCSRPRPGTSRAPCRPRASWESACWPG